MDDLLKKYGGLPNLRKHLKLFHEKVCEEKGVKHYFFGIKPELLIADQVNFRSLVLRKLDHLYRDTPPQTAQPTIRVNPAVFEDVRKLLERQLKLMGVNWREIPRMACHILPVLEETRSRATDLTKTSMTSDLIDLESIEKLLKSKSINTKLSASGEMQILKSDSIAYPFYLQLKPAEKQIVLIGRGYAFQSVSDAELASIQTTVANRWTFMPFTVKRDAEGRFIETQHVIDYTGGELPTRLFITLLKEFSWRFDEVMKQDKDDRLINLVANKT
jgi:hypothetical protein